MHAFVIGLLFDIYEPISSTLGVIVIEFLRSAVPWNLTFSKGKSVSYY